MIIIQMAGGLGNQMFQYALYLQLRSLGKEVKIDDTLGFIHDAKRDPALEAFGINYERPTARELHKMLDSSMLPWQRVRRKLFGRKKKSYFEEDKLFHPEVLAWDDIYLEGYWQTEKYFDAVAYRVKEVYNLDILWDHALQDLTHKEKAAALLSQIQATESVSIHVRGGDYLLPKNRALYGGICTEEYYREAVRQIKLEHHDCRFYLFTNDRELGCRVADGSMEDGGWEIIDVGDAGDYAEFVLMSRCKHHILANSSFSWWASYLNPNPDKTVMAPDKWLNGWDCRDVYRDDMRLIDAMGHPVQGTV